MSNREAEASQVESIRSRTSEWIDLFDACVACEPIHPRADRIRATRARRDGRQRRKDEGAPKRYSARVHCGDAEIVNYSAGLKERHGFARRMAILLRR